MKFIKNLHLIISTIIVIPTGFIYGSPSLLPEFLDIEVNTFDLSNQMKALMLLYLGVSLVWVLGIWKLKYWKVATQLNVLFMLSLGIGRLFSVLTDGFPSDLYLYGMFGEFVLGFFSIYQLIKYKSKPSS